MSIDELISEAARSGRLTGLTLWPCPKGFQANVQRKNDSGQEGWTCITGTEPAAALREALTGAFTSLLTKPTQSTKKPPVQSAEDLF